MFGNNQQEMLLKVQKAMEESKRKLEEIRVSGDAGGGLIRVEFDGNRKLISLEINTSLSDIEKEDLEDLLAVAIAKALEAVEVVNEQTMSTSAMNFLPKF
jgi:DNA-binding YbaB/EbfC family protein